MIAVFFLALALSMDAFAVSIGLGAKQSVNRKKLAFIAALYFGLFQGLMPLIGYWAGKGILGWVDAYADWIAFSLLLIIGGKMIHESFSANIEENIKNITHPAMLLLAIATSIDALAAVTTTVFSYVGVLVGAKSGTKLESKAELFGGVVLILIGLKILLI